MNDKEQAVIVKKTFDLISKSYDCDALRFFRIGANDIVEILAPQETDHVLDVACGTGNVSVLLAKKLNKGKVTGVDFAKGMIDQATAKLKGAGLSNTNFIEMDMRDLTFKDGSFDGAACAFGIFFVPDIPALVKHISSKLKPGGKLVASTFRKDYFNPLREKLVQRLKAYGVIPPPTSSEFTDEAEKCRKLFESASLKDVNVVTKNIGYHLKDSSQWWEIVFNAGFRRMIERIPEDKKEEFKAEHLAEIEKLSTDKGIWLDIEVLYTTGYNK